MIKEMDLKNSSGFSDATCEPGISFRRADVARWVIVLCGQPDYVIIHIAARTWMLVGLLLTLDQYLFWRRTFFVQGVAAKR
jgi:hypothetical protein